MQDHEAVGAAVARLLEAHADELEMLIAAEIAARSNGSTPSPLTTYTYGFCRPDETWERVEAAARRVTGVGFVDWRGDDDDGDWESNRPEIVHLRRVVWLVLTQVCKWSMARCARVTGHHHSTVIKALQTPTDAAIADAELTTCEAGLDPFAWPTLAS